MNILAHGTTSFSRSGTLCHTDGEGGIYAIVSGDPAQPAPHAAAEAALTAALSILTRRTSTNEAPEELVKHKALVLRAALRFACASVYRQAREGSDLKEMRASATFVSIAGDRAVVAHVGNTRLFLRRGDSFDQLTHDHTLEGDPSLPSELRSDSPAASSDPVLTRALGAHEDVQVDVFQFELLPGDRLLLANAALESVYTSPQLHGAALASEESLDSIVSRIAYIERSINEAPEAPAVVVVSASAEAEREDADLQRRDEALLRIDAVRKVFLFRELEIDELLQVAERAILTLPRENEVIFKEGEPGSAMYVLVEGRCALLRRRKTLAELEPGSHFGEMSLLSNAPRSGTVVARERCKMLRISAEDFVEIVRTRPATGVKLLFALGRELSERLARSNEKSA